jgi:Ca2+/Na+ antiporter
MFYRYKRNLLRAIIYAILTVVCAILAFGYNTTMSVFAVIFALLFLFYLWLYFKTRKEEPSKAEQFLTKKKKSAKERHEEKKELREKYINFIKEIEDDDFDYGDEDDE